MLASPVARRMLWPLPMRADSGKVCAFGAEGCAENLPVIAQVAGLDEFVFHRDPVGGELFFQIKFADLFF